jgi:hypothetical protein
MRARTGKVTVRQHTRCLARRLPRNHAAFWDRRRLELTPAYDLCPQPRISAQAMASGRHGEREISFAACLAASAVYGLTRRSGPRDHRPPGRSDPEALGRRTGRDRAGTPAASRPARSQRGTRLFRCPRTRNACPPNHPEGRHYILLRTTLAVRDRLATPSRPSKSRSSSRCWSSAPCRSSLLR